MNSPNSLVISIIVLGCTSLILLILTVAFAVIKPKKEAVSSVSDPKPCESAETGSVILDGVILADKPYVGQITTSNEINSFTLVMEDSIDGNFEISSKKLSKNVLEFTVKRIENNAIASLRMDSGFIPKNFLLNNMFHICSFGTSKNFNIIAPNWSKDAKTERDFGYVHVPSCKQPALAESITAFKSNMGLTGKAMFTNDGRAMISVYTGFGANGVLTVYKAVDAEGSSFEPIVIPTTIASGGVSPKQLLTAKSGSFCGICLVSRITDNSANVYLYTSNDGFISHKTTLISEQITTGYGDASMLVLSTGEVQIFVMNDYAGKTTNFWAPNFETEFGKFPDIVPELTIAMVAQPEMHAGLFENDVIGILFFTKYGALPSGTRNRLLTNEDNYKSLIDLNMTLPSDIEQYDATTVDFIFLPNKVRRIYISNNKSTLLLQNTSERWDQTNIFKKPDYRTFVSTNQISPDDPCAIIAMGPTTSSITHQVLGSLKKHTLNYNILTNTI